MLLPRTIMYSYNQQQVAQNTALHGSGIDLGYSNYKQGKNIQQSSHHLNGNNNTQGQQQQHNNKTATTVVPTNLDYHLSNLLKNNCSNSGGVNSSNSGYHSGSGIVDNCLDTSRNSNNYCGSTVNKQQPIQTSIQSSVVTSSVARDHRLPGQLPLDIIGRGLPDPLPSCHGNLWMDNCHIDNTKLRSFDDRNFDDPIQNPPTTSINSYQHMNGQGGPGMVDVICHKGSTQQRVPPAAHQQHNPYPHHPQQPTHQGTTNAQQQQQQQQQQHQHILNQHKNNQFCTQLPDSPPDSGSEPYSPPNGNHQSDQTDLTYCSNVKPNIMTSLPQQQQPHQQQQQQQGGGGGMYMNPMMGGTPHSSVTPPHTQVSPVSHPQTAHCTPRPTGYNTGYLPPNMGAEPPKLNHHHPVGTMQPITLNPQMLPFNLGGTINNLANQPNKKRKYESPNSTVSPGVLMNSGIVPIHAQTGMINIKAEPGILPDCDDDSYCYDLGPDMNPSFLDGSYQVIKWQMFQPKTWAALLDQHYKPMHTPGYRVDADKGFNFAVPDDAFVCQKKNHFQVTAHMELHGHPKYVKSIEGDIKPIDSYHLHFKGIKVESPSQSIKIEQSQSDRSKRPFYPVRVDLPQEQVSKITVGRLHFSETTTNNMRKKGKPNPDQRYFMLVVSLHAHSGDESYMIAAQASERIIVRASNPGQFDQDVDVTWQKGHTSDTVYHAGRVGINTDRPDETLTVHGNVKLTGHIIQPSDKRIKTDIKELDPKEQLKNINAIKVYNYGYDNQYADYVGMKSDQLKDTGVIAQEVREVLPDAVKETGDVVLPNGKIEGLQVVNKDRIYMENVGAVKELCKVTDKLENRINELETMNKKLSKFSHCNKGSIKSTCSTMSLSTCSTISHTSSIPRLHGSKLDKEFTKNKDIKELENLEKQDKSEKSEKKSHSHHHHHHRHHRHHHSHRQSQFPQQEEGMCSNRFIQVTIVILVFVMAFCLISITTLYVLEKQQPSPSSHHLAAITVLYVLEVLEINVPNWNQTSTTLKPADPMTTPGDMFTTGDWNDTEFEENITFDPINSTSSPTDISRPQPSSFTNQPPSTMSPPSHELISTRCAKDPSLCPIVCCKSNSTTFIEPTHENSTQKFYDLGNGYTILSTTPSKNGGKRPNVTLKPPSSKSHNEVIKHFSNISVIDFKNHPPYDSNKTPKVMENPTGRRKRRAVSSWTVKADLIIKELNKILDKSYCINEPCRNGVGFNFTYEVPLSPHFGRQSITLMFDLADSLSVKMCSHFQEDECDKKNFHAEPVDHTGHGWSLPVGYYGNTFYLFRVASTSVIDNVHCNMNMTGLGTVFSDYYLHFSRQQDESCQPPLE